jgi:hypothetical protein
MPADPSPDGRSFSMPPPTVAVVPHLSRVDPWWTMATRGARQTRPDALHLVIELTVPLAVLCVQRLARASRVGLPDASTPAPTRSFCECGRTTTPSSRGRPARVYHMHSFILQIDAGAGSASASCGPLHDQGCEASCAAVPREPPADWCHCGHGQAHTRWNATEAPLGSCSECVARPPVRPLLQSKGNALRMNMGLTAKMDASQLTVRM